MNNYIRKIVQMKCLDKKYISKDRFISYFKYERKNNKDSIIIVLEGLKLSEKDIYKVCFIIKKENKYLIEEARTLCLNKQGKYQEKIILDKKTENNFYGMVIIKTDQNKKIERKNIERKNIVLIGSIDEKKDINILVNEIISNDKIKDKKITTNGLSDINNSFETNNKVDNIKQKKTNEKGKDEKNNKKNLNTLELLKKELAKKEKLKIFDDLFETNEVLNPFESNNDDIKWIKIDLSDLIFLPLEDWILINNAFLINCYKKYKHLILGKDINEKIVNLGVPDIYNYSESIIANICGFNEFKCCKNINPRPGEYGYWIINAII